MVGRVQGESEEGEAVKFTVIDCEQRTEMWYAARAGRLTGSRAAAMLAKVKSGEPAAGRKNLLAQLVCERMTGKPEEDGYFSKEMQRGIDLEPAALGEYEARTGYIVERTGFLSCNDIMAGCSLDGHVGNFKRVVSIKCPNSATHIEYLKKRRLPPTYIPQATHEMWITEAEHYDFVSFDDRMPPGLEYFCVTVERYELAKEIAEYEIEVKRFLAEVDVEIEILSKLRAA